MVLTRPTRKETPKKRAAFLNAAKGMYLPKSAFVLQCNEQAGDAAAKGAARVGYTVTRKVGNAVVRNRVKRRLREAIRHIDDAFFQPDHDYVLVGRKETLSLDFKLLCAEIEIALKKLAQGEGRQSRPMGKRQKR